MKKQIASVLVASSVLLSGCASDWCQNTSGQPCHQKPVHSEKHIAMPTATLFAFDSAALSPKSEHKLEKVAKKLHHEKDLHVKVQGYTDDKGPSAYNLKLSQERAQSVATYLENHGVCAKKITTE